MRRHSTVLRNYPIGNSNKRKPAMQTQKGADKGAWIKTDATRGKKGNVNLRFDSQ